jgi:hypothetical protein
VATYYVDTAVGDDANAGTSEGSGNAWKTIDHAMNNVTSSDVVYVKASGTYSETPNIDTAGAGNSPIMFIGYTSTTTDNGKLTVSGTTNCMTSALSGSVHYIFYNFIFSGASSDGVVAANSDDISWINCEFNNNGGDGISSDDNHVFVNCVASGNTGIGFDMDSNPRYYGCISSANGGNGFVSTGDGIAYRCQVNGMGSSDHAYNGIRDVLASTIDGENAANTKGVVFNNTRSTIVDCILYDLNQANDMNSFPVYAATFVGYNLLNSNNTDYEHSHASLGYNDVTGAPAFTDETNDDYTLGASSAAIDAGLQPGGLT